MAPTSFHEHLGAAHGALSDGAPDEAERRCRAAIRERPDSANAHHILGIILARLGRHKAAVAEFEKAVSLDDDSIEFLEALGTAYRISQRPDAACDVYHRLVSIAPDNLRGLLGLARDAFQSGRLDEAHDLFRRATGAHPDAVRAWSGLGETFERLGNDADAEIALRRAIALARDDSRSRTVLGRVLARREEWSEAAAVLTPVAKSDASDAEVYVLLGTCRAETGDATGAVEAYRRAIEVAPDRADAHYNLGVVLARGDDIEGALECYDRTITLKPKMAQAYYNRGLLRERLGTAAEATSDYRHAIESDPSHHGARLNLAQLLRQSGQFNESVEESDRLLAADAENPKAHFTKGLALLHLGRLKDAWPEYEWRCREPGVLKRAGFHPFRRPRWEGERLDGETILVFCEQGSGDAIQFLRYLPMVKARGARILVECNAKLAELFQTAPCIDSVITTKRGVDPPDDYDLYVPLMSLPALFETTVETIPASIPYLSADRERIERWRNRMAADGFRVGLCWAGNPRHANDANRSIDLSQFAPLADVPRTVFYGLQVGTASEQAAPEGLNVISLGEDLADFADTAAAMASLDLIISVDTAAAHLAGALGRPAWTVLEQFADWRWFTDREDTPWYPTMRLFRQHKQGEWQPVFEGMAQALPAEMQHRAHRG